MCSYGLSNLNSTLIYLPVHLREKKYKLTCFDRVYQSETVFAMFVTVDKQNNKHTFFKQAKESLFSLTVDSVFMPTSSSLYNRLSSASTLHDTFDNDNDNNLLEIFSQLVFAY